MEDTQPKTFVFVLMPFSSEFADIYEVGIKQACKDAGAYCERVDEQIFDESILERVYNQISRADVIIAEMTGRNPNVFYEVGYAHALNKRVILLTQKADDIPFDLKQFPHIIYDGKISILKSHLEARVRWCVENPKESIAKTDINLDFYANGSPIARNSSVALKTRRVAKNYLYGSVKLDVHNNSTQLVDCKNIRLYMVMVRESAEAFFYEGYINDRFHILPDGRYMGALEFTEDYILPDSWSRIDFTITVRDEGLHLLPMALTLRIYSQFGKQDYPLTLYLPNPQK